MQDCLFSEDDGGILVYRLVAESQTFALFDKDSVVSL
jgi:hypothetical protein